MDENIETMLRQVYEVQKNESKAGDFVNLVTKDMSEIEICLTEDEIKKINKSKWKKLVKEKTKNKAFKDLLKENEAKEKTLHIQFECLEMSSYLKENDKTDLSKIIFFNTIRNLRH